MCFCRPPFFQAPLLLRRSRPLNHMPKLCKNLMTGDCMKPGRPVPDSVRRLQGMFQDGALALWTLWNLSTLPGLGFSCLPNPCSASQVGLAHAAALPGRDEVKTAEFE